MQPPGVAGSRAERRAARRVGVPLIIGASLRTVSSGGCDDPKEKRKHVMPVGADESRAHEADACALMEKVTEPPASLTISEGEGTVTFTEPDGRSRTYRTDGRKETHQARERDRRDAHALKRGWPGHRIRTRRPEGRPCLPPSPPIRASSSFS